MIDDPAAREHVAGVWGVDPDVLPGQGPVGVRAARRRSARPTAPKALLVFGTNIVVSRAQRRPGRRAARRARPAGRRRLRAVRDRGPRRRRPPGHAVGRGDRHHDQPRGPGDPAPARDHAAGRRAQRPRRLRRAGRAARRAGDVRDRAGGGLRRARPGQSRAARPTTAASPTTGSATSTACLSGATAADVHRARSRRPTAGRGSTSSSTAAPAEQPDDDYPVHLTTGRVLAQYQSGAQTRRVARAHRRRGLRRDAPDAGRADRRGRRRAGAGRDPPRRDDRAGPGGRARSGPTRSSCRSTGSAPNRLTNDALDPASRMPEFKVCAASGVGMSRAGRIVGNGMAAHPVSSATGWRPAARRRSSTTASTTATSPSSATSRARRTTGSCSRAVLEGTHPRRAR